MDQPAAQIIASEQMRKKGILKAAGTPMIKALPEPISVERLTLAPGFPSVSSMLGIESPTWTIFAIGGVYRVAVCFEVYSN